MAALTPDGLQEPWLLVEGAMNTESFEWYIREQLAPRLRPGQIVVMDNLTYLGLGPIQLLFLSSILAGLATPVTSILMVLIARDRSVMGAYHIGPRLSIAGFAVIGIVTLASVLFLLQTFIH